MTELVDLAPPKELVNVDRARARHGAADDADDAPASLRNLFAFLDAEPDWGDHARLDRAADALIRHTAAFGIALGAASLLRGAGNNIAGKPLVLTGRYASMPAIRSVEVGEWLRQVITPGGMRRDGGGFAYTVRVRLIHAHVRRGMYQLGTWDEAAWGVPIPQPYMAFTMAEFGHIALDAMHTLGVRLSDDDADALHIPDTHLKHGIRAAGPMTAAAGRARMIVGGGRERLSRRGYRSRDLAISRCRDDAECARPTG